MAQRRPVQSRVVRPAPAEGSLSNPLKGWAAYSHEWSTYALPARMTYQYVSSRELEPERGVYRFAQWETEKWDSPAARGKHVVFRLYLDYPNLPVGVPQWVIDRGVAMRPYDMPRIGKGLAPDCDDPRLLTPLLDLIGALGERYNTRWLPGDFRFSVQMPLQVTGGRYRLAIGIRDPWRDAPDIQFANKISFVNGWNVVDTISG